MENRERQGSQNRRDFLGRIAAGVAGVAGVLAAANTRLFAQQFLGKCPEGRAPTMVYDPDKQVMVDPQTGEPIYQACADKTTKKEYTPIVTPGDGKPNGTGPKGDGKTDTVED